MNDARGDFDRLERALAVFADWEEAGMQPSAEQLLAQHEELREVLEPLLDDVAERTQADGGGDGDAAPREVPDEIGGFRIEYELGRGGMGVVYAARQVALDRLVALKVLPTDARIEPRAVARFRRESALLAALDHPSLVEVLTVGREGACEFFAMELVDGVPLHRVARALGAARPEEVDGSRFGSTVDALLHAGPAKPRVRGDDAAGGAAATGADTQSHRAYFEAVARIAWQIADALAHAHAAGVLHRDVKSSNILLRRDGRAVLTDFGLAREIGRPSMTRSGEFAGTPYYSAPEQVQGRVRELDGRVDVFGLGVVLYELLTLRRPFEGSNSHEVAQAVLTQEPNDPSSVNRRVPADLAAIALRAIEKDPRRRYPSARAFADDLDAYLGHRPVQARRAGPLRRLQRYVRREPWKAALLLVVLLAVPSIAFLGGYLQARAPMLEAGEQELRSQRIDELLERATMLIELGERDVGKALLDEALEIDPAHPDTIGMIVWARCDKGAGMSLDDLDALVADARLTPTERQRLRVPVLMRLGSKQEAAELQRSLPPPQTATEAFFEGLAALAAGHASMEASAFRHAGEAFELAALLSPRRRPLYLNKLAHALGHAGENERRAQVAAALDRAWPDAVTQQYWSYFAEKDSARSRARERLQRAIELRSDVAAFHYNLGTSFEKSGLNREAIAPLRRATEMNPDYAPGYVNLSKVLFATGDRQGALAAIERAIELEPKDAMFVANRGQYLASLGRMDEARAAHEAALELDPAEPIALAGVAYLEYTQSGAEACRAFCRAALDADHACEELYRYLVMSLTTLRRNDDAVRVADEGLQRYPRSAWLHMRRAYAVRGSDRSAAIEDARRAVQLAPNSPLMHGTLGNMLTFGRSSEQENEEAVAAYDRQVELSPTTGVAYLNGAIARMRLGRADDAVARLRLAVERLPKWGRGHESLGALLLDAGRLDDAITALEAGLQRVPGDDGIGFRLAFALRRRAHEQQQAGDAAAARAAAQRGVELLQGRSGGDVDTLRGQLQAFLGDD